MTEWLSWISVFGIQETVRGIRTPFMLDLLGLPSLVVISSRDEAGTLIINAQPLRHQSAAPIDPQNQRCPPRSRYSVRTISHRCITMTPSWKTSGVLQRDNAPSPLRLRIHK